VHGENIASGENGGIAHIGGGAKAESSARQRQRRHLTSGSGGALAAIMKISASSEEISSKYRDKRQR